eukprot:8342602-Ditylum_brightwellii.AAC.1
MRIATRGDEPEHERLCRYRDALLAQGCHLGRCVRREVHNKALQVVLGRAQDALRDRQVGHLNIVGKVRVAL